MKRLMMTAAFLAAASVVWSIDLEFGGGAFLGASWSKSETETFVVSPASSSMPVDIKGTFEYNTNSFDAGGFLFAGINYAELSVGYLGQFGKVTDIKMSMEMPGVPSQAQDDEDYTSHLFVVDLLGKYPFAIGEKISLFPALGVGLKLTLAGHDYDNEVSWGLNLKGGGGVDVALTERLFFRGEALFVFQVASDREATLKDDNLPHKPDVTFAATGYYMGPLVKLAVGYKIPLGAKDEE
ncbi:MAG: hypothetical protein LBC77_07335 [Spirochaetaceae bacterium]|jgi:hypothetical protein|nr:hypothetical protein [Spirochaetaceae bacterium]